MASPINTTFKSISIGSGFKKEVFKTKNGSKLCIENFLYFKARLRVFHTSGSIKISAAFKIRYPPFAFKKEPALIFVKSELTKPLLSTVLSIVPKRFL